MATTRTVNLKLGGSRSIVKTKLNQVFTAKLSQTWVQFLVGTCDLQLVHGDLNQICVKTRNPASMKNRDGSSYAWTAKLNEPIGDFIGQYKTRKSQYTIYLAREKGGRASWSSQVQVRNNVTVKGAGNAGASRPKGRRSPKLRPIVYAYQTRRNGRAGKGRDEGPSVSVPLGGIPAAPSGYQAEESGGCDNGGGGEATGNLENGWDSVPVVIEVVKQEENPDNPEQDPGPWSLPQAGEYDNSPEEDWDTDDDIEYPENRDEEDHPLQGMVERNMNRFENPLLLRIRREIRNLKEKNQWQRNEKRAPLCCQLLETMFGTTED